MHNIKELSNILAKIENPEMITEFFMSILTEKEFKDLSSRWELVKMLDLGISQRTIAKDLGLSLCKITRGSKELKKDKSVLKKFLDISKTI